MEALTEKQEAMLEAIKQHITDYGFPPTVRKLQENFELASVNAVYQTLQALEKKGYILTNFSLTCRKNSTSNWKKNP